MHEALPGIPPEQQASYKSRGFGLEQRFKAQGPGQFDLKDAKSQTVALKIQESTVKHDTFYTSEAV